jgi:hypothetical protein
MLNIHRIPYLKQDREDIITEINLLLLGRVYTKIRDMRGKYKRKAGYGRGHTQDGRRTPRVVWAAIRRAIWSYFKWYVNKRLNDYPMIRDEDRGEVFERFATDDGKAARAVELEFDLVMVRAAAKQKAQEHLSCRRRSAEVQEVAQKIAWMTTWKRYGNCDALATDRA